MAQAASTQQTKDQQSVNPESSTDLETLANTESRAAYNTADEESAIIPGRFWTLPVICLVTTSFVLGANEFIMMGILPDIAQGLHISQVLVGNLVSIFAAVYAVACPLVAAFSARFQRKRIYLAMVSVFLIGNALSGFAPNYAVLALSRMIVALVAGGLVAVGMTFAPQVAESSKRTRFMAWVFSGFSLASVFGVPAGTWLAQTFGWRWAFHSITLLTIALLLVDIAVLPASKRTSAVGILRQFLLFSDLRIVLGCACVIFGAAATYVFYTYITPVLTQFAGVAQARVSLVLILFGVMALFSNLYSGVLARRGTIEQPLGRMWSFYAVQMLTLVLLSAACWWALRSSSVLAHGSVFVLVMALGFLIYLQNSPSQICYVDSALQTHPGSLNLSNSLNSMSFNTGIALGAAVSGVVYDHVGLTALGAFGAVFAFLAALSSLALLQIGRSMRASR